MNNGNGEKQPMPLRRVIVLFVEVAAPVLALIATITAFYLKSVINQARIDFHEYTQRTYITLEAAKLQGTVIADQLNTAQREREQIRVQIKDLEERIRYMERNRK